MRIVSWNVNGLRSLIKNRCLEKIFRMDIDVICFQETKLSDNTIWDSIKGEYSFFSNISSIKGRSGTAILSKIPVKEFSFISGNERCDYDGRFVCVWLENGCIIISLYMPHGGRDGKDISYKLELSTYIQKYICEPLVEKQLIICTDFNVAHKEIDLARPKSNLKNTMFTQSERTSIDSLLNIGFYDAFRIKCSEGQKYTWWPYSFNARERNLGWRIDYFFVSKVLKDYVTSVSHETDIFGSDHCPLLMDINLT